MSRTVNKVILIGNVGGEPDVKVSDNGSKAVLFSLATNWKSASGQRENTGLAQDKVLGRAGGFRKRSHLHGR